MNKNLSRKAAAGAMALIASGAYAQANKQKKERVLKYILTDEQTSLMQTMSFKEKKKFLRGLNEEV